MNALKLGVVLGLAVLTTAAYGQLAAREEVPRALGPRAWWCMDEGSGTIVHDCSGHGFDGAFLYDPEWVTGVSGTALKFEGCDMVWQIPGAFDDSVDNGFTIMAWVSWDGGSAACVIVDGRGTNAGFYLGINADGSISLNIYRPGGGTGLVSPANLFCEGEWTHVAGVFDAVGDQLRLFKDGLLVASAAATQAYYDSPQCAIGNNHWAPGDGQWHALNGVIDEVRFYDVALSAETIQQICCATPPPFGDMNCDGALDFGDINPFVLALTNPAQYEVLFPDCYLMNADINRDCWVGFGDINPFVECIVNGGCPCP